MSYTANSYSRRVADVIDEAVVIPVLTLHSVESGVALARALARGGLTVLEITLRTEVALAAIAAIAEALPEVIVGSGTCLSRDHLQASLDHGCKFAVSPGATPALLDAAEAVGLPLLPAAAMNRMFCCAPRVIASSSACEKPPPPQELFVATMLSPRFFFRLVT